MKLITQLTFGAIVVLFGAGQAYGANVFAENIGFVPPGASFTTDWTESLQDAVFGGYNYTATPSSDGTELIMTPDATYRVGWAVLNSSPICAREYEVTVEFNTGSRSGTDGGYLLGFETKAVFHNQPAPISDRYYGVRFYMNSDYRHNKALIPNNNAFQIWSNESPLQEYVTMTQPVGAINPLTVTEAPFPLKGSGWLKLLVHYSDGNIKATVSNGIRSATISGTHTPSPGIAFYPLFIADTGPWRNLQKIRNYQIRVIRGDDCAGLSVLTRVDELNAEITSACGSLDNCATSADYQTCALSTLEVLKTTRIIAEDDLSAIVSQVTTKGAYCNGLSECLATIPGEREAAYSEGYEVGYTQGYAAGVASVDAAAIKQAGFDEGVASIDQTAIYNRGVKDGQAQCTQVSDPMQIARSSIETLCPCARAKNHGAYVSCVSRALNKLKAAAVIFFPSGAGLLFSSHHATRALEFSPLGQGYFFHRTTQQEPSN